MRMRFRLVMLVGAVSVALVAGATDTGAPTSQESAILWNGTVTVRFCETYASTKSYQCGRYHGNHRIVYKKNNSRSYEAVYTVVLRQEPNWVYLQEGQVAWTFNESWDGQGHCTGGTDYLQAHMGTSGTEQMEPRRVGHIRSETVGDRTVQRYRISIGERKDMGGDWVEKSDNHNDNARPLVKIRGNRLQLPTVVLGSDNPSVPGGGRWLIHSRWETFYHWGPFKLENNGTRMQHSWSDTVEATVKGRAMGRTKVTHIAHVSWDLHKASDDVVVELSRAPKGWRPKKDGLSA